MSVEISNTYEIFFSFVFPLGSTKRFYSLFAQGAKLGSFGKFQNSKINIDLKKII